MQKIGVRRSSKVEPLLAVRCCPDGQAPVSMAAFPAEGMRTKFSLVTGHMDGKIHFWGSCADPVLSMTLSRDASVDHIATPATGSVVVAALGDGTIILISPEQHSPGGQAPASMAAFSPVGSRTELSLVTGHMDGKIHFWGRGADPLLSMTLSRDASVDHLAIPSSGSIVVAALGDGTILLICPDQQRVEVTNTEVHQGKTIVALKMWEDYFVTADSDGKVVYWNTLHEKGNWTTESQHRIICDSDGHRHVTALATGWTTGTMFYTVLAVGHGTLQVWRADSILDPADGKVQIWATLTEHHGPVTSIVITPDVSMACAAGKDGFLSVWDLAGAELLYRFPSPAAVCNMMFCPSRYWQVVQSHQGVAVIDLECKEIILRFVPDVDDGHDDLTPRTQLRFTGCIWRPDSDVLVVGRSDGVILEYNNAGTPAWRHRPSAAAW